MPNRANAYPTKSFFMEMLTRDIDLNDAILDLLDNCLDGAVRQKQTIDQMDQADYYLGYSASIDITKDSFTISDNCGGIPRKIGEEKAFMMGRSPDDSDGNDLPTVGIYGIGMKRAIFKIGRAAKVFTRNDGMLYSVTIPQTWATDDEWYFTITDLTDIDMLENGGTTIMITSINAGISARWESKDKLDMFIRDLVTSIRQSYSLIIQKGFQIRINGILVRPHPVQLLIGKNSNGQAIQPYLFKQIIGEVDVSLAVGFYAPPPSPDEIDDENEMKRTSSEAGWTVICNDRVVLYNDRTHLTGWGEAGVPNYHTQFIGIRGVVVFRSSNPQSLPMTTTKRGIDTSSRVYSIVKERMRQGTQIFTNYTNQWKGLNTDERKFSTAAEPVTVSQLLGRRKDIEDSFSLNFHNSKEGLVHMPKLPVPIREKPYRQIRYTKNLEDILDVVEYLHKDRDFIIAPSAIGEECFDYVHKQAKNGVGD